MTLSVKMRNAEGRMVRLILLPRGFRKGCENNKKWFYAYSVFSLPMPSEVKQTERDGL